MDIKGSLNCRFDKQIKAHLYTLFGAVRYSHNLPLPLGEVAERSEDGEGAACELAGAISPLGYLVYSYINQHTAASGLWFVLEMMIQNFLKNAVISARNANLYNTGEKLKTSAWHYNAKQKFSKCFV